MFFDNVAQEKRLNRNINNLSKESLGHGTKRLMRRAMTRGNEVVQSIDFGYKTHWKSPEYHLVNGKVGLDRTSFMIQKNNESSKFKQIEPVERHPPEMRKYGARPPIGSSRFPPNEFRFLSINKLPETSSMKKHIRNISFAKCTTRNLRQTLFPFQGYSGDYDRYVECKDRTMKNLNSVAVSMSKSVGRVDYRSHIPKASIINESCDPLKVILAKNDMTNGKRRLVTLSNMSNSLSRDDKMYTTTDFLANINMDNTRDERQDELDRKNQDRMMRMKLHTQQSQRRQHKFTNKLASSLFNR